MRRTVWILVLTVAAGTAATQQRGAVIHLTPKLIHDVKNPSKSESMKAVVFALYEKGQPATTPAK